MPAPPLTDGQMDAVVKALEKHHGNQVHAAASLGLNRSTFIGRLRALKVRDNKSVKGESMDVVERHRLNAEIQHLRGANQSLTKRLAAAEDHRASILGLSIAPAEPLARSRPARLAKHSKQAVVLH